MITKIHIKNYKSFGKGGVKLNKLKKINIFIGKNNVGKSNILRFIYTLSDKPLGDGSKLTIAHPTDFYKADEGIEFVIGQNIEDKVGEEFRDYINFKNAYAKFSLSNNAEIKLIDSYLHNTEEVKLRAFVEKFRGRSGGSFEERLKDALSISNPSVHMKIGSVIIIDEHRNLLTDVKLRNKLDLLINYTHKTRNPNERKSEELHKFVSSLFEKKVVIRVPSDQNDEIELVIGSKQLPLSSIGTGLHQIILMGMYVAVEEDKIMCIDEPELHTHPSLQRKFLEYISSNFNHQYFISTHSNAFLDYSVENKSTYLIREENELTTSRHIVELHEGRSILNDLGVRSSEILQANGVIWVEGPSDRIYINKWIEIIDPSLKEGLNYSFQFYGGSILSHYSVDDSDYINFIQMLVINRNAYIVIDSDMSKKYTIEDLRETKKRIISEAGKKNINFWITEGREIENYLSTKIISKYFEKKVVRKKFAKFKNYFPPFSTKVSLARKITPLMDINELKGNFNLEEKVREIVDKIKEWNLIE